MTRLERAVRAYLDAPDLAHRNEMAAALAASQMRPICYPDADLSSGLSWDGKIICGDRPSINAVKDALHEAGNVETFWRPELLRLRQVEEDHNVTSRQWREQFDAMHQRAMRAEALLEKHLP